MLIPAGLIAIQTLAAPIGTYSLTELENRLNEIDTRLEQLASYSLGIGIGAIGYRSLSHESPDHPEWIEIHFGHAVPLDEIVLIPAIRRDAESGLQADGFPIHFRVISGTDQNTNRNVIAEYTSDHGILPRIAPFIIPCDETSASWIRIEAELLSPRAFDQRYVFQLSEILAFSGGENIALHKPVRASSDTAASTAGWQSAYAVDGFMPYLMDAAEGEQSIAYLSPDGIGNHPAFILDLKAPQPISRIHLHAVDQSDTLPQAFAGDIGIPKQLRIEGANNPDFSDAVLLQDLTPETIYEMGPIMMLRFPETTCRYIRFYVVEPAAITLYGPQPFRFGFAEIEIFSNDRNVALGKPVQTNYEIVNRFRALSNLTDGRNMFGTILPIQDWLNQLATRHQLETERPVILEELNRRYIRQKTNLRRSAWFSALLVVATVIIILVDRIIRQRAIYRTRERIAADVHDELGANIHAIGLLGDLAQAAKSSPEKLDRLLLRMRGLTERTGAAARYCTNMLEAKGLFEDLVEEMKRSSARIMADLEHDLLFEGEEILQKLKARRRIDLFLFYKECLINIIRHSGATKVSTILKADNKKICLIIDDNGHGLNGEVPGSLKRRARLLGGSVTSGKSTTGGTRITLNVKLNKIGVFR
ncbi:histidine kinase [Pontiellaceae bacterium B1224]|nr:histidine kinase [Pontiellaceae bacterium B1224]